MSQDAGNTSGAAALDLAAAFEFAARSRSSFLRAAGQWLETFDDPADVLILLSGDVGQHLGPWDTFRHCALLGLHPSSSVKSLALDVLCEPVPEGSDPPIAPAIALSWAIDRFPEEPAETVSEMLAALGSRRSTRPDVPEELVDAAHLALAGAALRAGKPLEGGPDERLDDAGEPLVARLRLGLARPALAVPIWEGAVLGGQDDLAAEASEAAARGQQPDGGLTALQDHPLLRGFATIRGLALHLRGKSAAVT